MCKATNSDTVTITPNKTKVRIGQGKKVHLAYRCNDWRVGRTVAVLDDQNAEVTCQKCLGLVGKAAPAQPAERKITVSFKPRQRKMKGMAYARDAFVTVREGDYGDYVIYMVYRREGSDSYHVRPYRYSYDTGNRKVKWMGDEARIDRETATNDRLLREWFRAAHSGAL